MNSREQALMDILQNKNYLPSQKQQLPTISSFQPSTGGILLPSNSISLTNQLNSHSSTQLSTTTITLLQSPLLYSLSHALLTTPDYIIYSVRGGKIRIITQNNGTMALLRNHTQSILDLQVTSLQNSQDTLLASTSLDDTLRIWSISLSEPQINTSLLLTIHGFKSSNDSLPTFNLLHFHPSNPNILLASGNSQIFLIDFNTILQNYPDASLDLKDSTDFLGLDIINISNDIRNMKFSPDGSVFSTTSSSGSLSTYSLESKTLISNWFPFGDNTIDSIHFIDKSLVIVGSEYNRSIEIFNLATGQIYHDISFEQNIPTSLQNIPFNITSLQSDTNTLLVANSFNASLYAIHYTIQPCNINYESLNSLQIITDRVNVYSNDNNLFDFLLEFPVGDEIISMVCSFEKESSEISVYCIQTKTIQKFTFDSNLTDPANKQHYPSLIQNSSFNSNVNSNVNKDASKTIPTSNSVSVSEPVTNVPSFSTSTMPQLITNSIAKESSPMSLAPERVSSPSASKESVDLLQLLMQKVELETDTPVSTEIEESRKNMKSPERKVKPKSELKNKPETKPETQNTPALSETASKTQEKMPSTIEKKKYLEKEHRKSVSEKTVVSSDMESVISQILKSKAFSTEIKEILSSNVSLVLEKEMKMIPKKITDEIQKEFRQPAFVQNLSSSVTESLSPVLVKTFKDSFENYIIPSFEKGVGAMLTQIHATLDQGVKELLKSHSSSFEKSQMPSIDKLNRKLEEIVGQFKNTITISSLDAYFGKSGNFQTSLSTIVNAEVKKVFNSINPETPMTRRWSQNSILSPVETREVDLKAEIDNDLEASQFESAFTKALGSSDLSIVLHICQKVDPNLVFKTGKVLVSQPIILSLMHQISLDLTKSTAKKLKWLEECVMNLDKADPVISEHVGRILSIVHRRLEELIKKISIEEPESGRLRAAKMVLMMTAGFL